MEKLVSTVFEAVNGGQEPDRVAIEGIGCRPLTYGGLRRQVGETVEALGRLGYGRGDRIAVLLPNGPELATAFLSVAAGFTCAPLNPLYRERELEFYLSDLGADAVMVPSDEDSAAIAVTKSLGLPVITITSRGDEAGSFDISGARGAGRSGASYARPDDVALLLHTSGTTSRPKLVPLLQSSITSSARHMAAPLALTARDKCLNIMPLFHVHGLIGAVLNTLISGGGVTCTPGFPGPDFLRWLLEYRPTWYTAAPALHQKVLEEAIRQPDIARSSGLRFIRSSSASLPPTVKQGLEAAFNVPVIEAYGMTEAPHQISTNHLPPLVRKEGSVGTGTGVEIAIVDDRGCTVPRGVTGEIVLRGPSVIRGYANDPEANAKAFVDGWFRTGDQGHLDEDGYLYIDGRIKEIINRGGEKVSPREVEEALLSHPAVSEAVVFSVPDHALGEAVAAAVVLKKGEDAGAADLRGHVAGRLAYFKVPARLLIVDSIPKGPTGKVQRIGMSEKLGLSGKGAAVPADDDHEPPATPTEKALADMWALVLRRGRIGRQDSFFDLGGDSLTAMQVISRIRHAFGITVPVASFLDCENIARLGEVVDRTIADHHEPGGRPRENGKP